MCVPEDGFQHLNGFLVRIAVNDVVVNVRAHEVRQHRQLVQPFFGQHFKKVGERFEPVVELSCRVRVARVNV